MILKGRYTEAKVYTDVIEQSAIAQIIELCNQPYMRDVPIRIMPDVHSGVGCVIGTTFPAQEDFVVPNLIGVDIGCGVLTVTSELLYRYTMEELDRIVRKAVPSGNSTHVEAVTTFKPNLVNSDLFEERDLRSIGTLGGGNHYIEVSEDERGKRYLHIHSGSRHFGLKVAKYYQSLAEKNHKLAAEKTKQFIIQELKAAGKERLISRAISGSKQSYPKHLIPLTGEYVKEYLNDMKEAQRFAALNRLTIAKLILGEDFEILFDTVHNYIDEYGMLRKGAVSAQMGEILVIPLNMRDGSLLCRGKGNAEWNFSAPHGAGRLMSRSAAKENVNLKEFEESMEGIYTTSVGVDTIDEAPMAYKPMESIIENIGDTVEILAHLEPIYNYKSSK